MVRLHVGEFCSKALGIQRFSTAKIENHNEKDVLTNQHTHLS